MNCDLAFDSLTDAELVNSPELQAHLASCPRCRQMRQTLEPALELLTSPQPVGNSYSESRATATQPYLSLEAVQVAETAARQLGARTPASYWRRLALSVAKCAALLVIGGAMSAALVIPRVHSPAASTAGSSAAGGECLWKADPVPASTGDARSVILSCVACHLEAVR